MSTQNATPEMGRFLRQIVENYLEEGQFESGIAILDQMRSPDHKPSIIHILHLIFISLHSSSHDTRLDELGTEPAYDSTALLLQSPRKIVKQSKSALILSPNTIVAAQRLLFSFISTNSPSDIAAALPHYPDNEIRRQVSTEGETGARFGFDYFDSPIYNQSSAIMNSRSVWEILKAGYTRRAMQVFGTPKTRGKGKQSLKVRALGREPSFNTSAEVEELDVVGDDSWFLLEWLVELFEKDAEIVQAQGLEKYSRLLLRQLPPPPLNTTTRWDASEPLKVIAFSLQQSDLRWQRIGLRLLNLLIDLSQTPYLNLSSLTSTALAQIASSFLSYSSPSSSNSQSGGPSTPPRHSSKSTNTSNPLTTLFDRLCSTTPSLAFKISLCQKILQDTDEISPAIPHSAPPKTSGRATANSSRINDTDASQPTQLPLVSALKRPKPTPRIAPRPRVAPSATPLDPEKEAIPLSQTEATPSAEKSSKTSTEPRETAKPADAEPPPAPVAPTPAPAPRPRLPPFADISQLVKVQRKTEAPSGAPMPTRTRPRNSGGNAARSAVQTPWAAPGVLLRVKFELLHACTTLARRTREEIVANAPELAERGDVEDWTQSLSDGRMHELLLVAFGPQAPEANAEEAEDRAFYADVIKASIGFPIDAA